ncbi:MAG TPA: SDR family NAD(P)-dependent oxidoreductase [Polyangia bacterium]|jgi:hypothetical protein
MKTDLNGKRVLVTGASSGIGRALSKALAQAGAKLAIAARREGALEALADEIAQAGGARPVVLTADLSARGEAERLGARAIEALGAVDILVNNAGVGAGGAQVVMGDADEARALFETNYWAPLALTRALVPEMRKRGAGAVVNVASIGAVTPMPFAGHYSSSKAALSLATETLRLELRGSGVHVLHVLPGPVDTAMLGEVELLPGGARLLSRMPRGDVDTLARKIVRGLERGRRALVYPGSLAIARHLPTVAVRLSAAVMPRVDEDPRMLLGGSQGAPEARAVRAAFEQR